MTAPTASSQVEKAVETPAKPKPRWLLYLSAIGPGMVAAMAGNDAGGIATYSSVGALYGYKMLWMIPVMMLLLIVVQESAARMGAVTGKGFSSLIRERFGIRLTAVAMLALLVSNTAVTLSEFAGIASGMALFGIPSFVSVPLAGLVVWLLGMSGSYRRVEKVLLAVSCVFLTYVVAAFMAGPDWGEALFSSVVPHLVAEPRFFSLLIATIGTTIAPWMIFLAQNNVVDRGEGVESLPYQRADSVTGSVVACIVAWFIIITTGTVLYPNGIAVESAEDAAMALAPIAGVYAEKLFAAGLVAASFLAACVVPGVTSSAVCEAFGWERGADRTWGEAPVYNGIITFILVFSCAVVLIPNVNLFGIMTTSQVISGVLLPVLLVFLVIIINDRRTMGTHANSRVWNVLTWATIVLVVVLTVIMFAMDALAG
jgi:NRAMP (natural resistance-associated macrophage protein)-like metal ion transporter